MVSSVRCCRHRLVRPLTAVRDAACDVAVVGGGPAGATAALQLARRGVKVTLVEREPLPRYKTCGGGLVARGLGLLPPDVRGVIERSCERAELHLLDADLHYRATRDAPIMVMTMRDRLIERTRDGGPIHASRVPSGESASVVKRLARGADCAPTKVMEQRHAAEATNNRLADI